MEFLKEKAFNNRLHCLPELKIAEINGDLACNIIQRDARKHDLSVVQHAAYDPNYKALGIFSGELALGCLYLKNRVVDGKNHTKMYLVCLAEKSRERGLGAFIFMQGLIFTTQSFRPSELNFGASINNHSIDHLIPIPRRRRCLSRFLRHWELTSPLQANYCLNSLIRNPVDKESLFYSINYKDINSGIIKDLNYFSR